MNKMCIGEQTGMLRGIIQENRKQMESLRDIGNERSFVKLQYHPCGALGLDVCSEAGKRTSCYDGNFRKCEKYNLIVGERQ